jgi:hypothetical protein
MKPTVLSLTILAVLLGCSKVAPSNSEPPRSEPERAESPKPIDPNRIVVVETTEHKEHLSIEAEASARLAAKDFAALEDLADKYRISKECYPTGVWKLMSVYAGMQPGKNRPPAEWTTDLGNLREWVQAKPDSITARVALANALVSYGWEARGDGTASTVTHTGWKLFHDRLTEAVQVLKQSQTLDKKCPYFSDVLLTAAMGLGVDKAQYRILLQKAIAGEPGYAGYYLDMAYYLLPRWYGNRQDVAAFLQGAADKLSPAQGDLLYARVIWYLERIVGNVFNEEEGLSWERADRGFQMIESQFPDSLFVQNGRAYNAVMGCERTLAPRRLVDSLHGKIDATAWTSKENFIRVTRDLYRH